MSLCSIFGLKPVVKHGHSEHAENSIGTVKVANQFDVNSKECETDVKSEECETDVKSEECETDIKSEECGTVVKAEEDINDTKSKKGAENLTGNRALADPLQLRRDEADRTLIIKCLPLKASEKAVRRFLKLPAQRVKSIRFRSLPVIPKFARNKKAGIVTKSFLEGEDRKNAYVILDSPSSVDEAIDKLTGTLFEKSVVFLDHVRVEKGTQWNHKKSLFLGKLPFDYDEQSVYQLCSSYGKIRNVRIVRDSETSKSKGFGFVLFAERSEATTAYRDLRAQIAAGKCSLNVSRPDKPSGKSSIGCGVRSKRFTAKMSKPIRAQSTIKEAKINV